MRNITLIALSLLAVSVLAIGTAWSQVDMTVVTDTAFNSPQRAPSVFVHDVHNRKAGIYDCTFCHHFYKNGKLVKNMSSEDQSCSGCHALNASAKTPSLREAFHTRCIGCHKKENKGPIMCGECHVRNDS
jgi:predicted CXXCH cytochrome family protein